MCVWKDIKGLQRSFRACNFGFFGDVVWQVELLKQGSILLRCLLQGLEELQAAGGHFHQVPLESQSSLAPGLAARLL